MQILRRDTFLAVPWKNGGGVTHEAVRVPPEGEAFRWRVSVADVETAGNFSDFSGYHRTLVLMKGAGARLTFADGREVRLREAGDLVHFDGATAVHCEPFAGPCTDLNLIVARSLPPAQAWVAPLREPQVFHASPTKTVVLVVVAGRFAVTTGGEAAFLEAGDVAVMAPNDTDAPRLEPVDAATPPLLFCAVVEDNQAP